jgi:trans-2,3-dihydro-3-hydroxyanthranilate isomerase
MNKYHFYQLDVFTDKKFSGNPLAVFPEAAGISDGEMQQIANEMNLSETVFVLPSDKALRRLRIFTPRQELPLAGHPVVGTWNLLARLGVTPKVESGSVEVQQELNIGILPVEIEFADGDPSRVTMTQGKWESSVTLTDPASVEKFAKALGLEVSDLAVSVTTPIEVVSTGIRSIDVPVRSLDALQRIKVNSSLLAEAYLEHGAIGCYVFAFETRDEGSFVHARFFAPDDNIPEDAATGSAAGALAGYLMHHGRVSAADADGVTRFVIEQGDMMSRPSRIYASVNGKEGSVERVRIGGGSVVVAEGDLFL